MNKFRKPHGARPERHSGAKFSRRPSTPAAGQKFEAVCSNCGAACQVPFRPSPGKPVYCKNCFDAPRGAMPAPKGSGGEGKTIADLTRQIAAMNAKIDTMLKILEEGA